MIKYIARELYHRFIFLSTRGKQMSSFEILCQVIGFIGMIFTVISAQCKSHKYAVWFKSANESFFALQYLLIGAYTGLAMNLVSILRNGVFVELVKRKRSTVICQVLFSLVFVVFGIFTWDGVRSVIVIAAKVLSTVAYGMKDTARLRLLTLPSSLGWLIYNTAVRSWGGILCEVFATLSLLVGIIRLDLPRYLKKGEENEKGARS